MNLSFLYPLAFLLLPLAVLPWLGRGQHAIRISSLWLLPDEPAARWLEKILQTATSLLIVLLVVAMATPVREVQAIERTGQGAEIILLLDRSRSMDQPFVTDDQKRIPLGARPRTPSKGMVARNLLSEFVAARKNDRFGMVVFSTRPIRVLPLTDKQEAVLAAIDAGSVGRGLAETDITSGVMEALKYFDGKPYRGSRVVVMISDGASELRVGDKARLVDALKRLRVSFYWIYIRSRNAVDLFQPVADLKFAPQQAWHRFFADSEIPYRVYTAEDPQGLQAAIADISRLQNLPILYQDVVPRQDLAKYFYRAAAGLLFFLTILHGLKVRQAT